MRYWGNFLHCENGMWHPCRTSENVVCCSQKRFGGIVYVEIYRNAAVSDSVPAGSAVFEADILDLYRTSLHGGVDIRTRQRDFAGAVDSGDDMGISTAGTRDGGDCVSHKSLRNSDACSKAGNACRSDGRFFVGKGILKKMPRA